MVGVQTFYVAGRVHNLPDIQEIAEHLSRLGLRWSFDWTRRSALPKPYLHGDLILDAFAQHCIQGAKEADLFILFARDSHGARGMFIELGVALTSDAEIWIIGDEHPSAFSCLKRIHHASDTRTFITQYQSTRTSR